MDLFFDILVEKVARDDREGRAISPRAPSPLGDDWDGLRQPVEVSLFLSALSEIAPYQGPPWVSVCAGSAGRVVG